MIISTEDNEVVSNDSEMAETVNNYFVNVADGIGKKYIFDPQNTLDQRKVKN